MNWSDHFAFRVMVSSAVIKVVYVIGAIFITIGGLGTMLATKHSLVGSMLGGRGVIGGLLTLILGNLFWRIICELVIIFFSIHDRLAGIEKQGLAMSSSRGLPSAE